MSKLLLYAMALLVLISCRMRVVVDAPSPVLDNMTVHITPMWNTVAKPERVNALFYNPAGGLVNELQLPVDGGEVTINKGHYQVILCNPDAEYVAFAQMDRFAGAMARVTALTKSGHGLSNLGALFSSVFELPSGMAEAKQLMVFRGVGVTIRLKDEDGSLIGAASVDVRLRNVADGINLSTSKAYHTTESNFTVVAMNNTGVAGDVYSFAGSTFGCCVDPECKNTRGHEVYADIEVTAQNGSVKTVSADISTALKTAQESITTVTVDITVARLLLSAVVTDWTVGEASGGVTDEVR